MKKFFKEFKAFVTRGNVLDMAVGIIIGGAFTAIITALVNNILTPLLAMIPGTGDTGALQLVLREAVKDAEGSIVTEAVILDFGVVISAVITFLLTAFVLFLVVKTVNSVRDGSKKFRSDCKVLGKKEYAALRKQLKAEGHSNKEINEIILAKDREMAAAEQAAREQKEAEEKAAALANAPETLLREIRDLLQKTVSSQNSEQKE